MNTHKVSGRIAGFVTAIILLFQTTANAAEEFGIFELIHQSSVSYEETLSAVAAGLEGSSLTIHAQHQVRVPDELQQASVFVLTSPAYMESAAGEGPRTISAQILRVAVYTWGPEQQTLVNMTNPEAHAMIFYVGSDNYDALLVAARKAADDIRGALSGLEGESVSVDQSPLRKEKHYNKFKGDGPARMMAMFRRFEKSQRPISETTADKFQETVDAVSATIASSEVSDAAEPTGWEQLVSIPVGENAIYIGVTNPYIESKMITINSRFRNDGKTDETPYPGVDHVAALPTEVLVIREGGETHVLHYGQMWRMQLYFWDSGYRAFTANMGVPSDIFNSIEELLAPDK
jgi:hypothetical protein